MENDNNVNKIMVIKMLNDIFLERTNFYVNQ